MPQTISRLFASSAAADDAARRLRNLRIRASDIHVIEAPKGAAAEPSAADLGTLAAAIAGRGVERSHARDLAHRVWKGAVLVSAVAPFGSGTQVIAAMDAAGPIDTGYRSPAEYYQPDEDMAAPLSEILGLPVLGGRGDWLSSLFGLPALSKSTPTGAGLLITEGQGGYRPVLGGGVSGGGSPYRAVIPMPVLSGAAAGTSNRGFLGLPLLSGGGATNSNSGFLGLPLLIRS